MIQKERGQRILLELHWSLVSPWQPRTLPLLYSATNSSLNSCTVCTQTNCSRRRIVLISRDRCSCYSTLVCRHNFNNSINNITFSCSRRNSRITELFSIICAHNALLAIKMEALEIRSKVVRRLNIFNFIRLLHTLFEKNIKFFTKNFILNLNIVIITVLSIITALFSKYKNTFGLKYSKDSTYYIHKYKKTFNLPLRKDFGNIFNWDKFSFFFNNCTFFIWV